MVPPRRKRGFYREYLSNPAQCSVPLRTKYRRIAQSVGKWRMTRPGSVLSAERKRLQRRISEVQQTISHNREVDPEKLTNTDFPLHDELEEDLHGSTEDEVVGMDEECMTRHVFSNESGMNLNSPNVSQPRRLDDQDTSHDTVTSNTSHGDPPEANTHSYDQPESPDTDGLVTLGYSTKELIRALMILVTKFRHNATYSLSESMSEVIEALVESPERLQTKYKLKKVIEKLSTLMSVHHFCPSCGKYAGKQKTIPDEEDALIGILTCINCNNQINIKGNWNAGNIFIYLSLTAQLEEFFSKHGEAVLYSNTRVKESRFAIEDIFDGKLYKKTISKDMISINFSFDGVPIFNSSKYSSHPVTCTINEIAPEKRAVTMFLCNLYCGTNNIPDINGYLEPFIAECNELNQAGFVYRHEGRLYQKKCQLLLGICDSIARREIRNCMQFNGEYGCGFCKHPGEQVAKDNGTVRVYLIDEDGNAFGTGLRTHEETLIHAQNQTMGIKSRSILFNAENFDIINNLPPEWQHSVCLGVVRQMAKLWFSSKYHTKPFYCGGSLALTDAMLLSFKPSLDVSRTPRKMSQRSDWKAHEWIVFALFYSIPVLKQILPSKYVRHWALFIDAISILISTSIMPADVFYAQRCIFEFIRGVQILYGQEHVSYNIHLLSHLPKSVLDWGPLWTHSAFGYENFYQNLLHYVHSSNGPALQICNSFKLQFVVEKLYDLCMHDLTERQKKCIDKMLQKKSYPQVTLRLPEGSLVGKAGIAQIKRADYIALRRINVEVDSKATVRYFNRLILSREIFHSVSYSRPQKRQSYYVLLKNSEVFRIRTFIVLDENDTFACYAIGHYFQKSSRALIRDRRLDHLITLENEIDNLAAVPVALIKEKVVFIEMVHCNLIIACKHPNHCELLT